MFLLLFDSLSRISDRGLFFLSFYTSVFHYLILYHSCIFAFLFLLFRELFCKPHVKLIAPTAHVPFTAYTG